MKNRRSLHRQAYLVRRGAKTAIEKAFKIGKIRRIFTLCKMKTADFTIYSLIFDFAFSFFA